MSDVSIEDAFTTGSVASGPSDWSFGDRLLRWGNPTRRVGHLAHPLDARRHRLTTRRRSGGRARVSGLMPAAASAQTVLITGAAGNLGGMLARHLLPSGLALRLMWHKRPLASDLVGCANVTAVQADLRDPSTTGAGSVGRRHRRSLCRRAVRTAAGAVPAGDQHPLVRPSGHRGARRARRPPDPRLVSARGGPDLEGRARDGAFRPRAGVGSRADAPRRGAAAVRADQGNGDHPCRAQGGNGIRPRRADDRGRALARDCADSWRCGAIPPGSS